METVNRDYFGQKFGGERKVYEVDFSVGSGIEEGLVLF